MELKILPISKIVEDPDQPRKALDDASLAGLADSIRQHGLLNPITVLALSGIDAYRIVTGERRWRASQKAGLTEMACIVRTTVSQDADKTSEQLIENLQREDLTPLDKATAIKTLKASLEATNKEVALRLGLSDRTVGYLLDLLDLPTEIGEQIISSPNRPADGNLTEKHGRFLRQLNEQPDLQAHLVAIRENPAMADEILSSPVVELPSLLGKRDETTLSAGRGMATMLERIPQMIAEVKLERASAADLPVLEAKLVEARSAIDRLLAEVKAAQRTD
jgi:ParB family transcriptional regulator, chromosome partitioning protein